MSIDAVNGDFVTIQDVVKELQEEEEEAIAVLGAGDENNCTYPLGYMDRQALFSCLSCDPLHENLAGICYACSLQCHGGHDLVVLYTKRNVRCDCGNSKFGNFKCTLEETKDALNEKNNYNHNFNGKYCTCQRPYPDPEDEIEDEMIQCILCEDWFHSRHLGCLAPVEYSEMTCDKCVTTHSFLQFYKKLTVQPSATLIKKSETAEEVDVTSISEEITQDKNQVVSAGDNKQLCKLEKLKKQLKPVEDLDLKVMFWIDGWRNKICQCEICLTMYDRGQIGYIISETDTVAFYEKKGKENVEKVWEEAANTISQMNRVQQVELMQGYNDLKGGLREFLSGFEENQVVKKEDMDNFFEELNKRRKRRRLDGIPPDQCR